LPPSKRPQLFRRQIERGDHKYTIAISRAGVNDFEDPSRDRAPDQDGAIVLTAGLLDRPSDRFQDFYFNDVVIVDMRFAVGVGMKADGHRPSSGSIIIRRLSIPRSSTIFAATGTAAKAVSSGKVAGADGGKQRLIGRQGRAW
jgi:hypothetical protein